MLPIDRAKVCTECLTAPRRVRKGKKFQLCEDCRRIITTKKWKIRKLKRELIEGRVVQFYDAGWRAGYLVKLRETRADVQPVGPVGRIPDIIGCNIEDLKKDSSSKLWETVQDFYKANTKKKVVVLVADHESAARDAEISRYFRERAGGKPFAQQEPPKPSEVKVVAQKPVSITPPPAPKLAKARGEKIIIGNVYSGWTVDSDTGHARFACTCTCGKKKTIFSGYLRDGSAVCDHK